MSNIIYKPSRKARKVFQESDSCKITFLEGAVRSAKSFTANDLAIKEIQELPACDILISGYSIAAVSRNVMAEWKKIIDPHDRGLFQTKKDGKDEYLHINWRGLRNKKFYVRGAGKENDWMQIQGATFGYWYADELTRHCESFVDMALSRLSLEYSKGVWTTNPDHPQHYVKKRFIDDPNMYVPAIAGGRSMLRRHTFFLTDNPSLTHEYIETLKRSYVGFFYLRYIESKWTAAEGAVYDNFQQDKHVIPLFRAPEPKLKVISIDYGTSNPTSAALYGINESEKLKCWRIRSYYHNSRAEGSSQKSDREQVDEIIDWLRGESIDQIIVDPSAASFKVELNKAVSEGRVNGFPLIVDADNSVIDGIRTQGKMLSSGEYAIIEDESNQQCIDDYSSYLWDPRAQQRGEDKPLKENDHTKDEERYVLYTLFGFNKLNYETFLQY